MAKRLYESSDPGDWDAAHASFSAVAAVKNAALPELAAWASITLVTQLSLRRPPHLTGPELSRLMRFKLMLGRVRPNLQKYVDALTSSEVAAASGAAFAVKGLGTPSGYRAASAALCVLKGVGPATASLILAVLAPATVAFMSDDALEAIVGSRQYTLNEGVALSASCAAKAAELNKASGAKGWTANKVQQAVWAASWLAKGPPPAKGKAKAKRAAHAEPAKKRQRKT
jgi:hypothetical protein